MKKYIIITISAFLIILLSMTGYKFYKKYQVEHAVKIVKLSTDKVNLFEEIHLNDLISDINGTLIDNQIIDTTKTGEIEINFEYITDKKIRVPYTIKVKVIDITPPLIKVFSKYTTTVGNKNFYDSFFCGDDYDDTPKCTVEGDYDINTPGEYNVTFKAEDSSGNISENDFLLVVKEKENNPTKEPEKEDESYTDYNEIIKKYKNENTKIGIDISQFQGDIDFEKIKKFTDNIHCIFSDNDYFVSIEQKEQFEKLLNAKTIVVKDKGHISQDDDVFELEEILDECNKMIK